MTEAENSLWLRIRRKQIQNVQFYRQRSIGHYIVDFYAPSVKLVIELDGGQHFEDVHIAKDKLRDTYLQNIRLIVLRFNNFQILKEIDAVMTIIYLEIEKKKLSMAQ